MRITDLGGHSGCKILLCETDNENIYVRKVSSDLNYNKRLELQAIKQSSFCSNTIKAPKVLKKGYTDEGLFFFDMEYIQGKTMAEYMKTIEIGKIKALVESIVREIVAIPNENESVNEEVFLNKINELSVKLEEMHNPIVNEAIEMLQQHSWCNFAEGKCHGDLTLENIIVKDNQLYFIDFLDSFYDCWILDISTLMQDVQTMWSYRFQHEVNINTLLRLIVFRDILMDNVKTVAHEKYIDVYYALLLKLIRIYPYTKDMRTFNFLNEKTESVMDIIKKEQILCEH